MKAAPDTPLLYVLRGELNVMTPKFGCGLAQCGACSVLVNGEEVRACIYPIMALEGKQITTVDGLPARWQQQRSLPNAPERLHPVQQAWIDEQVPQCGICQYGMMIKATELFLTHDLFSKLRSYGQILNLYETKEPGHRHFCQPSIAIFVLTRPKVFPLFSACRLRQAFRLVSSLEGFAVPSQSRMEKPIAVTLAKMVLGLLIS